MKWCPDAWLTAEKMHVKRTECRKLVLHVHLHMYLRCICKCTWRRKKSNGLHPRTLNTVALCTWCGVGAQYPSARRSGVCTCGARGVAVRCIVAEKRTEMQNLIFAKHHHFCTLRPSRSGGRPQVIEGNLRTLHYRRYSGHHLIPLHFYDEPETPHRFISEHASHHLTATLSVLFEVFST